MPTATTSKKTAKRPGPVKLKKTLAPAKGKKNSATKAREAPSSQDVEPPMKSVREPPHEWQTYYSGGWKTMIEGYCRALDARVAAGDEHLRREDPKAGIKKEKNDRRLRFEGDDGSIHFYLIRQNLFPPATITTKN